MSLKNLINFMNQVPENKELQKKFQELELKKDKIEDEEIIIEKIISIASEEGYEIEAKDFQGELPMDELEGVVGGSELSRTEKTQKENYYKAREEARKSNYLKYALMCIFDPYDS